MMDATTIDRRRKDQPPLVSHMQLVFGRGPCSVTDIPTRRKKGAIKLPDFIPHNGLNSIQILEQINANRILETLSYILGIPYKIHSSIAENNCKIAYIRC